MEENEVGNAEEINPEFLNKKFEQFMSLLKRYNYNDNLELAQYLCLEIIVWLTDNKYEAQGIIKEISNEYTEIANLNEDDNDNNNE
jgi:hypothetical protein